MTSSNAEFAKEIRYVFSIIGNHDDLSREETAQPSGNYSANRSYENLQISFVYG